MSKVKFEVKIIIASMPTCSPIVCNTSTYLLYVLITVSTDYTHYSQFVECHNLI